jgi:transposase
VLAGISQTVKVAHCRLAYSRRMFVAAYPRETQEMVLDAPIKAFEYFRGVPKRMVYDNLKKVWIRFSWAKSGSLIDAF